VNEANGRAGMARPSLRSIPVLLVTLAALLVAPPAQAAPPVPILTGTDPPSPNIDLAPYLHGNSSGVIISSLSSLARTSAISFAPEPGGRTITVFTNTTCEGIPAAEGSPAELDTVGIQVSVQAETTTYFTVEQSDATGSSGCSNVIEYKHVKELPPPPPPGGEGGPPAPPPGSPGSPGPGGSKPPSPPRLWTIPGGIANDETPLVTGSAPGAVTVKIFTNSRCEGAPVAVGSVAQLAEGISVHVVDNVIATFYGVSVGPGGATSRCSEPAYYVEDSLAPHTRITMGPASKTRKRKAVFRFTDVNGDMPGTRFSCRVGRKGWKSCSSPLQLRGLHPRRYVVRVKAVDLAGNVERKPAVRSFKVVTAP